MTAAVDPALLKKTQEELGKYVKKPPLTDKLLSKPPFRFLHDIINAVITGTGFLDGLFTDDELSSQNIKDKEAKVAFLQKCIDATSIATGETFSVRPSKIVAGQDVEKTNEWLQGLGRAISKKVDSSEAVQQVLSGVKPEKPKKSEKEKQEKKPREKSSKKETDKPEKKDNGKKEVSTKKGSTIKNKDTKNEIAPNSKNPNSRSENPKPSNNRSKANAPPIAAKKQNTTKEKDNSLVDKAASKALNDKTSVKGPSKKDKSKDEKEKKKSSSSKSKKDSKEDKKDSKEEKEDKEKDRRKSKSDPPPTKPKSSKSRAASRMSQVKESGKENSPPEEIIENEEVIPSGEGAVDDVEPPMELQPSRPPSSRKGPPSLTGMAGEEMEIVGALDGETLPQETDERENDNKTPLISSLVNENNNIDPAILKAMAPNGPSLEGEDHLGLPSALEAPDSGVGSLESPKHPPDQEQQDSSETNAPTPTSASKSGPQPLRALEHFGEDPTAPSPSQFSVNDVEEQPNYPTREKSSRPRTGRRSARPPSARPAPPKVRERREIPKEELPRPSTGKPVANVILSSDKADGDDDDDNFMVEETKPVMEDDLSGVVALEENATAAGAAAASVREDGEGAGLLVAQILETKKELEDGRRSAFSPETPGHRRVQIEQSELSDANRRKEREIIEKDVQKLSGSIQSITRSVNPLAKMLDYLQEDLDSMQKELEMWRDENKKLAQTLKREQSMTEQELEPLRSQLAELESAVQEQRDKLSAVKSNILRNSEKISRLMAGINLHM
ncbi:TRAF3-interacting protein 1-like isoform X2 [Macrobrachium nipponense]|uniref:TRAF3-interacting protein 1-like isoform X2 n=1 Tax=Macrobrachium nipponense TaxID=159736 RepID=UPI0030C8CC28